MSVDDLRRKAMEEFWAEEDPTEEGRKRAEAMVQAMVELIEKEVEELDSHILYGCPPECPSYQPPGPPFQGYTGPLP